MSLGRTMNQSELGKSKVGQFDVACSGNQQVFRFKVAMYDATIVKILQSEHNLRGIDASKLFIEENLARQQRATVPTAHILHHHVELILEAQTDPLAMVVSPVYDKQGTNIVLEGAE